MRKRAIIGALIITLVSTQAGADDFRSPSRDSVVRSPALTTPPTSRRGSERWRDRARVVPKGAEPSSDCPRIKAGFDSAMTWAMTGARPDVCDYSMWDVGCNNVFKSVTTCNSNHCTEKCHQQDTLVIDIYHCGLPNVFKQLVNSYAGMSQASRDACMARLKRQGL